MQINMTHTGCRRRRLFRVLDFGHAMRADIENVFEGRTRVRTHDT